jgi:hypothetical protein
MGRRRPPRLWRIASIFSWAAVITVILLGVFLATVGYSASQLRPGQGNQNTASSVSLPGNGTVVLGTGLNFSNPGFYAITQLGISLESRLPSGSLVAVGGSPTLTVAAKSTTQIPVSIWVPLNGAPTELLTQDLQLPTEFWANATYATIFHVHLNATMNYSWGAPFANFNATPSSPAPQANGTVLVPVQVSFSNDASFLDSGTFNVTVRSSSGAACSAGVFTLSVPAHGTFDQSLSFYLSGSCNPAGGSVTSTFVGNGFTAALPPEAIP